MEITTKKLATFVSAIDGIHGDFSVPVSSIQTPATLIGEVSTKTKANRERD